MQTLKGVELTTAAGGLHPPCGVHAVEGEAQEDQDHLRMVHEGADEDGS